MLTIGPTHEEPLRDSVVRAWGRAASEAGAFSKLRIFRCESQNRFTSQILTYLRGFPALSMLVIYSDYLFPETEADRNWWHCMEERELRDSFLAAKSTTWQDVYINAFNEDGIFDMRKTSIRNADVGSGSPVLDFVFGRGDYPQRPEQVCRGWFRVLVRKDLCTDNGISGLERNRKRLREKSLETDNLPAKKRAARTSKQRTMEDQLAEFERH